MRLPFRWRTKGLAPASRQLSLQLLLIGSAVAPHGFAATAAPEVVPPRTPGLEERIRQMPRANATAVADASGMVQVRINDTVEPLIVGGIKGFVPHEKMRVKVWKETGYDLVLVYFDLGYMCSRYGYVSPPQYNRSFWDGPDTYVREDIEKVLWRVLQVYPKAQIILWPWLDVYPGWADAHPGELMRNEEGQFFIVRNHFERVGDTANPEQKERFAWSLFSPVFRQEAGDMLREFVRTVETSLPGRRVAGYILGGGQDAQLYAWDPPNFTLQENPSFWADYSAPALRAWRTWLTQKYGTAAKLSEAWGFPVESLETAPPPSSKNLVGKEAYHDPAKERQEIDWVRFLAEGRADFCSYFASVVRTTLTRPALVGVSGGDSGSRYALTATSKLLRDPNIDLLFHQPTYGAERRLPPAVGGINAMLGSNPLHQKLFLADMDQRTWITESLGGTKKLGVISFSDQSVGRAQDIGQLRAMWRREMSRLWADGAGALFHPLVDPDTYEDPAIKEELTFLHGLAGKLRPSPASERSQQLAVIYDERSVSLLKGALAQRHSQWTDGQQAELNASGVPYTLYYADDLRDGLVPPARMYLFINLLDIDSQLRHQIATLKANGATLVWLQGAGFVQAGHPGTVSDILGLNVSPDTDSSAPPDGKTVPLSTDLAIGSLSRDPQAGWKVIDPSATAIACYPGTDAVGAAIRQHDDWRSVFIGTYIADRNLINSLAKLAGARRITDAGNVVCAGEGWISIHPLREGNIEIHLDRPASLAALWPETLTSPTARDHTLSLKAGTTYLFKTDELPPHDAPHAPR